MDDNDSLKPRGRWLSPAILFLLMLLVGTGYAQDSYRLSYQWFPGEMFQYSVYVTGQVATSGEPTRVIMRQYQDSWEVLEELRGKRPGYRIMESSLNFTGAQENLQSFGVLGKDDQVERVADDFGRVVGVTGYNKAHRFFLLPLTLSPDPVAAHGKWKLKPDLLVPVFDREVTAKATVNYTFEDVARRYKGRRQDCARIRVDADYSYQAKDKSMGVSGVYSGKLFFDLAGKNLVDYQINEERKEWIKSGNQTRNTTLQVTSIMNP